eukprot:gb/GECH01011484.1/.p1 GENE.gb/GECH01011484.1/~~gb/GECH01011484.1/.p1  ORF type:complete len:371 (+),score=71.34 gb/GECH01011484.1/:1-1113(+)
MVVLSNFQAKYVPLVCVSLAIITIGVCYVLATSAGHTPPFPHTDITHCARYAPESFIFRIGMLPSSTGMILLWFLAGSWINYVAPHDHMSTPGRQLECILGYIASCCLIISSSVLESNGTTAWPIHVFCASSFFVLSIVAQSIVTVKLLMARHNPHLSEERRQAVSDTSVTVRCVISALQIIGVLLDISLGFINAPSWSSKALEWILTTFIVGYHIMFYFDWGQCNLGVGGVINEKTSSSSNSHEMLNRYPRNNPDHAETEPDQEASAPVPATTVQLEQPHSHQPSPYPHHPRNEFPEYPQRVPAPVNPRYASPASYRTNSRISDHGHRISRAQPYANYQPHHQPVYHVPHRSDLDAEFEEVQRMMYPRQ